ncbi:MAG: hypothetical protein GYB68_09035 [Chloroflexi bacterium]|nr:hypothetical protein [Chloroflexota bacterium]
MPISVQWHNPEQTIVRWDFSDPWSFEEFVRADDLANSMTPQVSHLVWHVLDFSQVRRLPRNVLRNLPQISKVNQPHDNFASPAIVVGSSGLTRVFVETFERIYGGVALVDTVEQAEARVLSEMM